MKYNWRPRPGMHYFTHHKSGKWICFELLKVENEKNIMDVDTVDGNGWSQKAFEVIKITLLGNSTQILKDIIEEARDEYTTQYDEKTVVYRYGSGYDNFWKVFGKPKDKRPWKTIVTQNGIKEELLQDIKMFQRDAEWYNIHGVPHRRGYLLHGPPGTGKSSLVLSLAGELGLSLSVVTLSDKNLTDDELMNRMVTVPTKSIVLMEDIDVALPSKKRTREIETKQQRGEKVYLGSLTMSGILNAIDGVTTSNGQILIMTTNHKEHLDPALIRPGR